MWRTSSGERVLRGAEGRAFRAALAGLWRRVEAHLHTDRGRPSGVAAFDELQPSQQLAVLALIGEALLRRRVPAPALTAVSEGAIGAVFAFLHGRVRREVRRQRFGRGRRTTWRRLVLAAALATDPDVATPGVASLDLEAWETLVEGLADHILWDRDFEMADLFLDAAPELHRRQGEYLGIAEDYFRAVAPDPRAEDLPAVRHRLRALTGRAGPVLRPTPLAGFEDLYHNLLVGPCDPAMVQRETTCRFLQPITLDHPGGFDCAYRAWVEHLRAEVHQAAGQPDEPPPAVRINLRVLAEARRAEAAGIWRLPDGHRIERRTGGWIVLDLDGYALANAATAEWIEDAPDDEEASRYASPEEAYAGLVQAHTAARTLAARRARALDRLRRQA